MSADRLPEPNATYLWVLVCGLPLLALVGVMGFIAYDIVRQYGWTALRPW